MAFAKLINLFAISSLAVLLCTLNASPVTALSENGHAMRMAKRHHGIDVAKRTKRSSSGKRCRPKTSTSVSIAATTAVTKAASTTQEPEKTTSTKSASSSKSTTTSSSSSSGSSSGGSSFTPSGNGKVGLAWPNGNDPSLSQYVTSHVK